MVKLLRIPNLKVLIPIDMGTTHAIEERYSHTRKHKRASMQLCGEIARTMHRIVYYSSNLPT